MRKPNGDELARISFPEMYQDINDLYLLNDRCACLQRALETLRDEDVDYDHSSAVKAIDTLIDRCNKQRAAVVDRIIRIRGVSGVSATDFVTFVKRYL